MTTSRNVVGGFDGPVHRTASASVIMPDAGKPSGRCEECGPHGNGGRVELLFTVVDCLVCAWRADFDALRKVDELDLELRAQARPGETAVLTQEISPLDPAWVWGRRVKVTCTYSKAIDLSVLIGPADPRLLPPIDARGLGVTPDPCCLCGVMTFGRPRAQTPTGAWYHVGPCP